jgi:hypothetical protein
MVDRPAGGTGSEMRRWNEPVDTSWHPRAACYGVTELETRLFEPVGLDEDKEDAWRRAAYAIDNYCRWCEVRAQCRAEGRDHVYEGVWGGEFRERRGVVDTDTGLVWRPEHELATTEPDPEPGWVVEFETITTKRGVIQYVLLTTDQLLSAG